LQSNLPPSEDARNAKIRYRIGEWHVDPQGLRLLGEGEERRLEPKTMALLLALMRQPGEVLTRDALEESVWQGRLVSYDAVANTVAKLRKALGDVDRERRYIETVSKTGYRLIAAVTVLEPDQTRAQNEVLSTENKIAGMHQTRYRGKLALVGAALLLVAGLAWWLWPELHQADPADNGIAVLPFENLGATSDQDYLANGITSDLITDLAKLHGLRVIARDSAFAIGDGSRTHGEIARDLGVRYLVQGSVQQSDGRLRINARLFDTRTEHLLWAERYEREVSDLFRLQDELVSRIVGGLELELAPAERERLGPDYRRSVAAYDAFLQGLEFYSRRSPENHQLAAQQYRRALEIDPRFARAYAGLALVRSRGLIDGWDPDPAAALREARSLADTAERLAPDSPQVLFVQSQLALVQRDFALAKDYARRAIALNPGYADAYAGLAWIRFFAGEAEAGLADIERAQQLNPRMPAVYLLVRGMLHYLRGDASQAITDLEQASIANPGYQQLRIWLAAVYMAAGRSEEARWQIDELLTANPNITLEYLRDNLPIADPAHLERLLADLRQAGLKV